MSRLINEFECADCVSNRVKIARDLVDFYAKQLNAIELDFYRSYISMFS